MYTVMRQQGKAKSILRESDNAYIPLRAWGNSDWIGFVEWVLVGNAIDLSDAAPTFAEQKAAKIAAIDAWLVGQDEAGIDCGNGVRLKSDANAATQLSVYLSTLTPGVDTILVSDVLGVPHVIQWPDLTALTDAFKSEFNRRRIAWATAKGAAMQATTAEELNAVTMPQ